MHIYYSMLIISIDWLSSYIPLSGVSLPVCWPQREKMSGKLTEEQGEGKPVAVSPCFMFTAMNCATIFSRSTAWCHAGKARRGQPGRGSLHRPCDRDKSGRRPPNIVRCWGPGHPPTATACSAGPSGCQRPASPIKQSTCVLPIYLKKKKVLIF